MRLTPSPSSRPYPISATARAIRGFLAKRVERMLSRRTRPGSRPGLSTSSRSWKSSTRIWSPAIEYERWTRPFTMASNQANSGTKDCGANLAARPSRTVVGSHRRICFRAFSICSMIVPSKRISLRTLDLAPVSRARPAYRSSRSEAWGKNRCGSRPSTRSPATVGRGRPSALRRTRPRASSVASSRSAPGTRLT